MEFYVVPFQILFASERVNGVVSFIGEVALHQGSFQ
jgi:hypothetical protein